MRKNLNAVEEKIIEKIYFIRGQKIMLDRDLALLYDVPTKVLKQAVRRNKHRFPADFMFELTTEELQHWRSHFVTSNAVKMGLRHAPFCFTEHGVAMLSSVLNTRQAIEVNIRIIRIFTRMREVISSHKQILLKLGQLENKVSKNDDDIHVIFKVLKQLLNPTLPPRKKIGFIRHD